MEISLPGTEGHKWTYADLLSSYRFWSMAICFCLISIISTLNTTYSLPFWQSSLHIRPKMIGAILAISQYGMLIGVIFAWFLCRLKNRYSLYIVALLLISGTVSTSLATAASGILELAIGQFFIGVSQGAISLLLPTFIAAAVGSIEVFAIVFGICLLIKLLTNGYLVAFIFQAFPESTSMTSVILAIVALLILLPIAKSLFYVPPPERRSSTRQPVRAEPIIVALLTLVIPFYIVYWFVRIHREIQSVKPSSQLMTARGAGWLSALMPFGYATLCLTLSNALHSLLESRKGKAGMSTGWVLFWGLLLPPIGVAIIQTKMNRLIATDTENTD